MPDRLYACTLSPGELAHAASLYAQAATTYQATVTYDKDAALVHLHGDKPQLTALLDDMLARESGCCSHLTFESSESADGYTLNVRAVGEPDLAGEILRAAMSVLFPTAVESSD